MEKYLKGELAYVIINRASIYNAPEWIASGFSSFEQGNRITYKDVKLLLEAMINLELLPINLMEGSFLGLTPYQYELVTKQSLSIYEFLIKKFDLNDFKKLVQHLSQSQTIKDAIQKVYKVSYWELEELWKEYLIRTSG